MSDSTAHVMIRYSDDAAIIECLDSKLNDLMTIQTWSDELLAAIDSSLSKDRVIVSFSNVKFMSSSALRALITLKNKADEKGIFLFLCNIDANNMEVFKITKLDHFFRITRTELEAQRAVLK